VPPHVFDWLLPDQLGACVNPGVSDQARAELLAQRIGLLINLHERPDSAELLEQLQATTIHMVVPNSDPPTQDQLDRGVAAIDDALARGVRVTVHCGAGLGRTGTLLAAYLVSHGSAPDAAIAQVRATRPGSIETDEQERAVHEFAQRLAQPSSRRGGT
jgi:atypical dual specificity phosphatase